MDVIRTINTEYPMVIIVSVDASQVPFLVKVCTSANQAKEVACSLIDQNLPVIIDRLEGMSPPAMRIDARTGEAFIECEGPYWLVFSDYEARDILEAETAGEL